MFLGQYQHTIDEKGRMTIPVRFRELLENGAFITEGFEQNLLVLTKESFDVLREKGSTLSLTDPRAREFKRIFFGGAREVEFDKAGRILIPFFLRDKAQLKDEAMVVGIGDSFEIWSPEVWKQQQVSLNNAKSDEQHFSDLNISIK
ncbi:MAG: division/cell wall cluster transcriptional repressor MraZ [Anaerolineaceae bacterium]|jgi:MraZ protein